MPINFVFQRPQYQPDLDGARGGLNPAKQEDYQYLQQIKKEISSGVIDQSRFADLVQRHPKAAADFNSAKVNADRSRRVQQIIQSGFTQAQPASEAMGPPTRQGGLPGVNGMLPATEGGFEQQRVTRGLLSEGLYSPEAQQQVVAAAGAIPVPPKPLTTSNVINTINPDTGQPEIVPVEQAIGRQKAPSVQRNLNENVDDFLKKIVPPKELKDWRNNRGQAPRLGTKYGELEKGGFALTELAERKQSQAAQSAELLINNLAKTAFSNPNVKIFATGDGWLPRVSKTIENAFSQLSQSNVDLETFNSNRRASLSLIIRALGEVGTLNVQDIQRIDEAVPKANGYGVFRGSLVDRQDVAKAKFKKLASFLKDMRDSLRKRGQGPTPKGVVEDYINGLGDNSQALTSPSVPEGWSVIRK